MHRPSIPETGATKALVCVLCCYEVGAIISGRIPTITALHRRWPVIGVVLVGALVVHFLPTPEVLKS